MVNGIDVKYTIKDLKKEIENLPDDMEIVFKMQSGCCDDYEYMELSSSDYDDIEYFKPPYFFTFAFKPLAGYKSCIQAGKTLKADKEYWENIKKRKE